MHQRAVISLLELQERRVECGQLVGRGHIFLRSLWLIVRAARLPSIGGSSSSRCVGTTRVGRQQRLQRGDGRLGLQCSGLLAGMPILFVTYDAGYS
jgi:hypothetical protein